MKVLSQQPESCMIRQAAITHWPPYIVCVFEAAHRNQQQLLCMLQMQLLNFGLGFASCLLDTDTAV